MKVRYSVEMDIPAAEEMSPEAIEEAFDHAVSGFLVREHISRAMKWTAKAAPEDDSAKKIVTHHESWAKICEEARWTRKL